MPRQSRVMDDFIPGYGKIRKRVCPSVSSSSTSSRLNNYRSKRAILVGKTRGGSRSITPVPTWKTTSSALRGVAESPASQSGGGRSRPVSARKLAATLWEMNEMPSPRVRESLEEKKLLRRENMRSGHSHWGSVPRHLSDPSDSPVSERMDRSGTGSRQRTSLISQRLRLPDYNVGVLDSRSSASLMEIETRSQAQTTSGSVFGVRTRLKDVSNALITSKELVKIINRISTPDNQPSTSIPLISALHAELERARLHVNQLIKEQCSDQNEINYLMKCFAEEKATWKKKEQQVVEAAIESITGELEVERKLRRRCESLNKKLGRELADTKASFMKAVKELESEKRARERIEQVCDDLATDIGEDRAEVVEVKRESAKFYEDVEREREMLQLADKLHEERVQMKNQFEVKNAVVDKLRNKLEEFLRPKRGKKKGCDSLNIENAEEIANYLSRTRFGSHQNEEKEDDDGGEVEDRVDCEEDYAESDLHSIELNMDNNNTSFKWTRASAAGCDPRRVSILDEMKGRNSISRKVPSKSTSLQRSTSNGVEWAIQSGRMQNSGDGLYPERFHEREKQAQRKDYGDDMQRYKCLKGLRDHILSSSVIGSARDFPSPTRQWEQPWPLQDPGNVVQERPCTVQGSGVKSRLADTRGEGQNARRSKQ